MATLINPFRVSTDNDDKLEEIDTFNGWLPNDDSFGVSNDDLERLDAMEIDNIRQLIRLTIDESKRKKRKKRKKPTFWDIGGPMSSTPGIEG